MKTACDRSFSIEKDGFDRYALFRESDPCRVCGQRGQSRGGRRQKIRDRMA